MQNFDRCMVLPGNVYSRGRHMPVKRPSGMSLLDLLDAKTGRAVAGYMRSLERRFRQVGPRLVTGWQALKPMAWMMKYSSLAEYETLDELLDAEADHLVLDHFIFQQAAQAGMLTGGIEDGSYMCLLFDTIETVPEASACVYLSGIKLRGQSVGLLLVYSAD